MNPASASLPSTTPRPMHGSTPARLPIHEDAELDKIMQDVGHEMKKADRMSRKGRLLSLRRRPKAEVPFHAQPISHPVPKPQPAPRLVPAPATQINLHPKPQSAPHAVAKAQKQNSAPVFVIFVTVLVTGVLIAAAIAAYRQG